MIDLDRWLDSVTLGWTEASLHHLVVNTGTPLSAAKAKEGSVWPLQDKATEEWHPWTVLDAGPDSGTERRVCFTEHDY
jgi:hypothetical protein